MVWILIKSPRVIIVIFVVVGVEGFLAVEILVMEFFASSCWGKFKRFRKFRRFRRWFGEFGKFGKRLGRG